MDWLGYTLGGISHIWMLINILGVLQLLNDPRVQYLGAQITIKWHWFLPFAITFGFWMWFFFG